MTTNVSSNNDVVEVENDDADDNDDANDKMTTSLTTTRMTTVMTTVMAAVFFLMAVSRYRTYLVLPLSQKPWRSTGR